MNKVITGVVTVLILGGGLWYAIPARENVDTFMPEPNLSAKEKVVRLTAAPDGQYSPEEIRVGVGTKLIIEGDPSTLVAGMDTVIIEGYGIRKLISPGNNIIEFTADKRGTYRVYCANGMGNGKLIVE
jgi:plastocyanin domain-containing protein